MDAIFVYACLVIFGVIFGSFAGATVWRIRAKELANAKRDKETYDKAEYRRLKPLASHTLRHDRSQCLSCGRILHFVDLIPVISWVSTRGKCRYCYARIGYFEPLMELGTALAFVVVYVLWPYDITNTLGQVHLILWLVALVPLAILFAYDLKWFLLPSGVTYIAAGIGLLVSVVTVISSSDYLSVIYSILGGVAILSGIYFVLHKISKGKWVGFGDVELGLALALLLVDWKLAFIALFTANFIGCMIVLPGMLYGNVKRTTEVQFGPLLIVGAIVALLFGENIITWYAGYL